MGKIENWYKKALIDEVENPSVPPNLILGLFGIYYYLKWNMNDKE